MALYKGTINANGIPLLRLLTVAKGRRHIEHLTGLIDTGATRTFLGQGIVEQLGLEPDGMETITTAQGTCNSAIYNNVQITFPDGYTISVDAGCTGSYYSRHAKFHLAIGMDILENFTLLMNGPKLSQYILFDIDYKLKLL